MWGGGIQWNWNEKNLIEWKLIEIFVALYFQLTFQIVPMVPAELYGRMSHLILTVHLKKTGGNYESTDQISCVNFLPCLLFECTKVLIGGEEGSMVVYLCLFMVLFINTLILLCDYFGNYEFLIGFRGWSDYGSFVVFEADARIYWTREADRVFYHGLSSRYGGQ